MGGINILKITIPAQHKLQIQCNYYENNDGVFHSTGINKHKNCVKMQQTPNSQNDLEKKKKSCKFSHCIISNYTSKPQ